MFKTNIDLRYKRLRSICIGDMPFIDLLKPLHTYQRFKLIKQKQQFKYNDQRCPIYLPWLTAKPVYDTPCEWSSYLESNFDTISAEYQSAKHKLGNHPHQGKLVENGQWQNIILHRGHMHANALFPNTQRILDNVPHCFNNNVGLCYFSVISPGTHIKLHCGKTNFRIRYHLTIQDDAQAFIVIANQKKSWQMGKCLKFDDSFLHEVFHQGKTDRVVLLLDMWHPELSQDERIHLNHLMNYCIQ